MSARQLFPAGSAAVRSARPISTQSPTCSTIGFPRRDRDYWVAALRYLKERNAPEGFPRYGLLLAHGDRIAGVLLLIFSAGIDGRES